MPHLINLLSKDFGSHKNDQLEREYGDKVLLVQIVYGLSVLPQLQLRIPITYLRLEIQGLQLPSINPLLHLFMIHSPPQPPYFSPVSFLLFYSISPFTSCMKNLYLHGCLSSTFPCVVSFAFWVITFFLNTFLFHPLSLSLSMTF